MARRRVLRGGYRENAGRKSMFPGKVEDGVLIEKKVSGVLTRTGHAALMAKRDDLTAREGRPVSTNEALEWCIRKATRTSMDA